MKRGPVIFVLAVTAELLAFPLLLLEGKTWPDTSCLAVEDAWIRVEAAGRFYHDLKNLMTELFRCSPQWWAKFSGFVMVSEMIVIVALLAWVISLKIKEGRQ